MIRQATQADSDRIVELCKEFYHTTDYVEFAPYHEPTIRLLVESLTEVGVMLVATLDDHVVGFVALVLAPYLFNHEVMSAHEVAWYMEPEARDLGLGKELLLAIAPACKEKGAVIVQMVHLRNSPPQAAAMYEKLGYHFSEGCYTKVL